MSKSLETCKKHLRLKRKGRYFLRNLRLLNKTSVLKKKTFSTIIKTEVTKVSKIYIKYSFIMKMSS